MLLGHTHLLVGLEYTRGQDQEGLSCVVVGTGVARATGEDLVFKQGNQTFVPEVVAYHPTLLVYA